MDAWPAPQQQQPQAGPRRALPLVRYRITSAAATEQQGEGAQEEPENAGPPRGGSAAAAAAVPAYRITDALADLERRRHKRDPFSARCVQFARSR